MKFIIKLATYKSINFVGCFCGRQCNKDCIKDS